MTLSIIIPCANDEPECNATIASIRATTPPNEFVEIVCVDDCSASKLHLSDGSVILHHNTRRIGVGPSRHLGVTLATGKYILLVDAHERFAPGWYETLMAKLTLPGRENTLHYGSCHVLDEHDRLTSPHYGATINFYGPDKHKSKLMQVLECVWQDEQPGDDYATAGCMGAFYAMERDWFLHINPLRFLRTWGVDEIMMSLKTWLAGGEVRFLKQVKFGHRFRPAGKVPFQIPPGDVIANKLFAIHTCLPTAYGEKLIGLFPRTIPAQFPENAALASALKAIERDWHLVETERACNRGIFIRDFEWYLQKWALYCP